MSWRQLITPNIAINENAGWCLSYARKVFGRPVVEPTAWQGWQNAKYKHTDRNFPQGVSFPVWFDWWGDVGNGYHQYGHVAVVHTDGRVWSSPLSGYGRAWFNSIDDLTRAFGNGMKYVGWSEDISGARVITKGESMINKSTHNKLIRGLINRPPNASEIKRDVGKRTTSAVLNGVYDWAVKNKRDFHQTVTAVRKQLTQSQDALKKTSAALDAARREAGMSTELRRQLKDAQAEADKAIRRAAELEAKIAERDEAVNSVWQTIGDLINKLLRR